MIYYFNKKLEIPLDSVLEPVWKWLMASSWKVKTIILLASGLLFYAVTYPDVVESLYKRTNSIAKVLFLASNVIPLDKALVKESRSIVTRLSRTVSGDLLKLHVSNLTPWSAAQAVMSLADADSTVIDKNAIVSFIRSNTVPGCACWTELPKHVSEPQCTFISGWVIAAFADAGVAATNEELKYILDAQDQDRWWPTFHIMKYSNYASTYSTAWILIGLLRQKEKGYINKREATAVDSAIARATGWLLSVRGKGARWKPYPRLNVNIESESISGLVLHALHLSAPHQVASIDREWLESLPFKAVGAADGENYYVDMKTENSQAIDHFVQLKAPWMMIATVDAYESGTTFQRAKALRWLETTLSHDSYSVADADEKNWWRAELLYGMRYVLKSM